MFKPLLAILAFAAPTAVATAQTRAPGDWNLEVAPTGCIVHAATPSGTVLSIWGAVGQESLKFLVQNKGWDTLEDGASYDLQVSFDGKTAWPMEAVARLELDSDGPGLTFDVKPDRTSGGATFVDQFAGARGMQISRNGQRVETLSLSDTKIAMEGLAQCLSQVWSARNEASVATEGTAIPVSADATKL